MRGTETAAQEHLLALSDVLAVMSRSPHELQPVLDAVVQHATKLCRAQQGFINMLEGDHYRWGVASWGISDEFRSYVEHNRVQPIGRGNATGRAILDRRVVNIPDALADPEFVSHDARRLGGFRALLGVPMLRDGVPLGVITLWRTEPIKFSEVEVQLVESFAQQAAIALENVRLFNETKDSLERQTAISEILRVIAGSPTDVQPVLDAIADGAARFCGAENVDVILQHDDGLLHPSAHVGVLGSGVGPFLLSRETVTGRSMLQGHPVHVDDLQAEGDEYPLGSEQARAMGHRTTLATPLLRGGRAFGAILLRRADRRPFTGKQIDLVRTFADQAVIAIENVRLFNETKEALERETAVGEILKVISASPDSLQPVFDAIAAATTRFCAAEDAAVMLVTDGIARPVAHYGLIELVSQAALDKTSVTGTAILEKRTVQVEDVTATGDFPLSRQLAATDGWRTALASPLVRAGEAIGAIVLRRKEPRAFTDRQVELVETFASQAAIAIENVRLFNETKEALAQQTAVADVLASISRSAFDLDTVLRTIVERAAALCGADTGVLRRIDGDELVAVAGYGPVLSPRGAMGSRLPIEGPTLASRSVRERRTLFVDDARAQPELPQDGPRSRLAVPILRDGTALGTLVLSNGEVRPFTEREVRLVEIFADQAAIAIENVRLFNETKEALEQQTATAEVLKTISRSVFDLDRVLETVVENAARLADGDISWMSRRDGDVVRAGAQYGRTPELQEFVRRVATMKPGAELAQRVTTPMSTVLREGRTLVIDDLETEPDLDSPMARSVGARSLVFVPLLRGDLAIGGLAVARQSVRPFSAREIEVIAAFADQAAIAIENVRLFNETKEALDQQTATSEVLQSISRSAFDLQSVLNTVVERAAQLCSAEQAWMRRIEGDEFRFSAYYGASPELRAMFEELRLDGAMAKIDHRGMGGRAVLERGAIHVHDIAADEQLREASLARRGGGRTCLAVPMLRDGEPIGAIVVARNRIAPFSKREIQLVETFADQAVIAIENVRLFNDIQEKSRQLEVAGRHKSEFLANMSHELRTPLNAIIGFSEVLLQGMFGELNAKQREYQDDVLSSGRHLLTLINDILDLSKIEAGHVQLELAEFSLPSALDNAVTMIRERASRHNIRVRVDVEGVDRIIADERKVKQIVANLLSNAVKFTPDGGHVDIRAAREDGEVRIAVRDTGIGIDDADRERIFEEFQQARRDPERSREGTGLGLALSRRYVELHGGRIWVESEVGRGSTFTFTLPLVPAGKEG